MMQKYQISQIEPFNEFFYASCFVSSLIPILIKYNIPIEEVMINCLNYYVLSQEGYLTATYKIVHQINEILEPYKAQLQSKMTTNSLIYDIQESISSNQPVILYVDCYSLPYREDTYQKMHLEHTLLIYGFDKDTETFLAIEHTERNSLDFHPMSISYEVIQHAYEQHVAYDFKGHDRFYSFLCIEKNTKCYDVKSLYKVYLNNLNDAKVSIQDGLAVLESYTCEFDRIASNPDYLLDMHVQIAACVRYIIKAKRGEVKLLTRLYADEHHLRLAGEVLQRWININNIINYYSIRLRYKPDSVKSMIKMFYEISEIEHLMYAEIL